MLACVSTLFKIKINILIKNVPIMSGKIQKSKKLPYAR